MLDAIKVLAAVIRQIVGGGGSTLHRFDVARVLGIEDPQGIVAQATLRILAQPGRGGGKERDQRVAITLLRFGVAQTVEAQHEVLQTAAAIKIHLKQDALGVLIGLGDAEGFHAELVVLAETSLLWFFVTKVRAEVIHLHARALVIE